MQESIRRLWKLILVLGILNAVFGLFILFAPSGLPRTTEILLGVIILLGGIAMAADTVIDIKGEGIGLNVLMVILRFVTATLLLVGPPNSFMTAVILVAIYFGIDGALSVGKGVAIRKEAPLHLYVIALGITSIVFSLLLWLRVIGTDVGTLRLLVGILFLCRGLILVVGALSNRGIKEAVAPPPPLEGEAPSPTG